MTVKQIFVEPGRRPKLWQMADVVKQWIKCGESVRAREWARLTAHYAFEKRPDLRAN